MPSEPHTALLVFFGHPDDEFAVFPWLTRGVKDGQDVHCFWLTDGGWGGQDVVRRRNESIRVLSAIGIPLRNMHFVGETLALRDGSLYRHLDVAIEHVIAWARGLPAVAEILLPAWEGGHHDHDAGHLLGLAVASEVGAVASQYSLYHGAGLTGPWFRVLSPLPANGPARTIRTTVLQRAKCVLRCLQYRSQWKSFAGLLPFYVLRLLRTNAFVLQETSFARTAERPHEGALLYERRGGPAWSEFAAATTAYRCPSPDF